MKLKKRGLIILLFGLFVFLLLFLGVKSRFEAPKQSAQDIQFMVGKETTLQAIARAELAYSPSAKCGENMCSTDCEDESTLTPSNQKQNMSYLLVDK